MTPEERAFLIVLALLSALQTAAFLVAGRSFLRNAVRELRLGLYRARRRRHVRAVFATTEPRRVAGFLSHLNERSSEPPPSAFVHVLPAREVVVHRPVAP